jgi:hypothetical protein
MTTAESRREALNQALKISYGPNTAETVIENAAKFAAFIDGERFAHTLLLIQNEAWKSIHKHGEQGHLPDGTGPNTLPLETAGAETLHSGLLARGLAARATADTKASSHNEGGDGTVTWWQILREEVFEASAEDDPAALRTELIQVAAVALKWIAALDVRMLNKKDGSVR